MMDLTIYIRDNCMESERALEVASFLKSLNPAVNLSIINVDRLGEPLAVESELVAFRKGPVYVLNGKVINLGNPEDTLALRQMLDSEGEIMH